MLGSRHHLGRHPALCDRCAVCATGYLLVAQGEASGHCTFYRNTAEVNRLFERIPDVSALLSTSHYEHLDERELTKYVRAGPRVYWDEELATNAAYQKALGDESLTWNNGRTFGPDGRELMYIHFHKLKEDMDTIDFGAADAPPRSGSIARVFLELGIVGSWTFPSGGT